MTKCLIVDSDCSSDSDIDIIDYRPECINNINITFKKKTSEWCKKFRNIKITGEIKTKKNYYSFTIFDITKNGESFKCKYMGNGERLDTKIVYDMFGSIIMGKYGLEFVVDNFVAKRQTTTQLESLKETCNKNGYFSNKKSLDFNNLNHITILSKEGSQGYNDFIEHLKIPLKVKLVNICLEGENTKRDIVKVLNKITKNTDLILIMRGGGMTTDISLSFDHIEIFKAIRECKIPVMTAIGHTKDCKDSLLITEVSDIDCHTPTTAANYINVNCLAPLRKLYESYIISYQNMLSSMLNENNQQFHQIIQSELEKLKRRLSSIKQIYKHKLIPSDIIEIPHSNNTIYVRRGDEIIEYKLTAGKKLKIDINILDEISNIQLTTNLNQISNTIKSYNVEFLELHNILERSIQYNKFLENYKQNTDTNYNITLSEINTQTIQNKQLLYNKRQISYYNTRLNEFISSNTLLETSIIDNIRYNQLKSPVKIDKTTDIIDLLTGFINLW